MKSEVLIIWPSEVPTSANAFTYHYIDYLEPISYLESKGIPVSHINMGLLDSFKQELNLKLLDKFSHIALYADIHMKSEVMYTYEIIQRISPESKLMIYGPITSYYKEDLLNRTDKGCYISGVGDFEKIIESFFLSSNESSRVIHSDWLTGEEFVFPNLDLFDPNRYQRLLELDRNRNQPLNIGLSISRGCNYKCTYCRMTVREDFSDRRAPTNKIIDYINTAKKVHGVEYFKFLSPNFGYDKKWCLELVEKLKVLNITWKCCTRPEYFYDNKYTDMYSQAGCKSVSVGLEVFSDESYEKIGRSSKLDKSIKGIKNLISSGISVKCLVMLGIPGVTSSEVEKGVAFVESLGAVVRPSLYTDYSKISWHDLEFADKRTPVHIEHQDDFLMELTYDRKGKMY